MDLSSKSPPCLASEGGVRPEAPLWVKSLFSLALIFFSEREQSSSRQLSRQQSIPLQHSSSSSAAKRSHLELRNRYDLSSAFGRLAQLSEATAMDPSLLAHPCMTLCTRMPEQSAPEVEQRELSLRFLPSRASDSVYTHSAMHGCAFGGGKLIRRVMAGFNACLGLCRAAARALSRISRPVTVDHLFLRLQSTLHRAWACILSSSVACTVEGHMLCIAISSYCDACCCALSFDHIDR